MSHREDKGKGRSYHTDLYINIPPTCLPIVYHPDYNITFMGLEKLHPFDAGKWGKVIHFLKEEQFVTDGNIVEAREATEEDLLVVHTKRYLNRLKWSLAVATITEIPPLLFLPNFLVQRKVLRPLRTQTGGTIMANIGVIWLAVQLIAPTDHPRSLCSSFFVIFVVSVPAWCCCFLCVCMLTWWIDSKCWSGSLEWTA